MLVLTIISLSNFDGGILFFLRTNVLTFFLNCVIIFVSMGVDGMFRDIFSIVLEMLFSIFIIIFGYYIWDGFDQTDYETAKYFDNIKDVEIVYESNIDNGYEGNNMVVSVHNISDKNNKKDIILKLNRDSQVNNLKINNVSKNLNEIFINSDDFYNYYLIENAKLDGYETKIYFVDVESDKFIYDYEFITEV